LHLGLERLRIHLGVDRRGGDRRVAQELLHLGQGKTAVQEPAGVGVAQGVRGDPLFQAGLAGQAGDQSLDVAGADRLPGREPVVPTPLVRTRQK